MNIKDRTLECSDCGKVFTFSGKEQEFFQSKGFVIDPKRCPDCRLKKRARYKDKDNGRRSERQSFSAVCAKCGLETTVPFKPRNDRPIYCNDCFRRQ